MYILFEKQVKAKEYKKPASEQNSAEYAITRRKHFISFLAFLPLSVLLLSGC
jgi:hypothetical protein